MLNQKLKELKIFTEKFDFIVSRAVTQLERFCPWVEQNIAKSNKNELQNGIIYLKGGDLERRNSKSL